MPLHFLRCPLRKFQHVSLIRLILRGSLCERDVLTVAPQQSTCGALSLVYPFFFKKKTVLDGDDALATSNFLVICRWLGIVVFPQLVVKEVDSISLNVVMKQGIAKQEIVSICRCNKLLS